MRRRRGGARSVRGSGSRPARERSELHDGVPQQHRADQREHPRAHGGLLPDVANDGWDAANGWPDEGPHLAVDLARRRRVGVTWPIACRFRSSAPPATPGANCCASRSSHPHLEVKQVTSERLDGQFVHFTHPNLRKAHAAEVRAIGGGREMRSAVSRPAARQRDEPDRSARHPRRSHRRSERGLPPARRGRLRHVVRQAARKSRRGSRSSSTDFPELHRDGTDSREVRQRRRLQRHGDDARDLAAGGRRSDRHGPRHHLRSQSRQQRRRRGVGGFHASSRSAPA